MHKRNTQSHSDKDKTRLLIASEPDFVRSSHLQCIVLNNKTVSIQNII